ncbi:MAG TPA: hypothetical protein DCO75_09380 [Fibrobacteres bacterium]|nr:hypothetical protein [Fibrobacterota bacterium]
MLRWPDWFVCPKCNHHKAWYLAKHKLYVGAKRRKDVSQPARDNF